MRIFDGPAIDLFDLIPKKKKEEIKRKDVSKASSEWWKPNYVSFANGLRRAK